LIVDFEYVNASSFETRYVFDDSLSSFVHETMKDTTAASNIILIESLLKSIITELRYIRKFQQI